MCVINQKKGNSLLLFELFHKVNLMLMNVLKGKSIHSAFLGVKTDRNPLHNSDIVHRTLLIKVSKGNMPALLINIDGSNGRRNFLNQGKTVFQIFFVCSID